MRQGTPQYRTLVAATAVYSEGSCNSTKAIDNLEKAALLWHELNAAAQEATLSSDSAGRGGVFGAPKKSLDYYERAMLHYQALHDRREQASLLQTSPVFWSI